VHDVAIPRGPNLEGDARKIHVGAVEDVNNLQQTNARKVKEGRRKTNCNCVWFCTREG
jgi:hypothetical protein